MASQPTRLEAVLSGRATEADALAAWPPELSGAEAAEFPYVLAAGPDTMTGNLMTLRARWDITRFTVCGRHETASGPVTARICGQS